MEINKLTNTDLIKVGLKGITKEEVIIELANVINENGKLTSLELYLEDVFKREKEYTTGIGRGVAIPHGKSDGVKESCVAIGIVNDVEWDSMDGNPVQVVILLAVPKFRASNEHLMILAKFAELLMDDDFTTALINVKTSQEMYELLLKQEELVIN